jgi:acyl-CoA synthetase (AMP-forming)/AMP-acid ligase II
MTSFHDDIRARVRLEPTATAFVDARDSQTWSYAELLDHIERSGGFFASHGATPARPVLSLLPNSTEAFVAFLAALDRGQGFAPFAPDATSDEVVRWASLVKPALCLVCETTEDNVLDARREAKIQTVAVTLDGGYDWYGVDSPAATPAPTPARLYLTTSGSTGEPRALIIDGDRLWSSGKAFCDLHDFLDGDVRFFNILPMSYLGGLFNLGLIPLAAGGSVVIAPAFSGLSFLSFWQDVERYDVNVLWLVPTIVRGLLSIAQRTRRHEAVPGTQNVRACFIGTAPIDLATKERFEGLFDIPVLENYGLSETTFLTSETLKTRTNRQEGSVGAVLPYVEMDFVAAQTDGPAAPGEQPPAQVRAKTPFMFLGYLNGDGTLDTEFDDGGFLATGDLGEATPDNLLIIGGRLRDIIKKGGYLVPLREIETLAERHPAVEEAIAVGLAHEFYGESYNLLLRLANGGEADTAIDSFGAWLRGNLVRYKWPEAISAVTDVPRTSSGKVRKHFLAEQLASGGVQ